VIPPTVVVLLQKLKLCQPQVSSAVQQSAVHNCLLQCCSIIATHSSIVRICCIQCSRVLSCKADLEACCIEFHKWSDNMKELCKVVGESYF